MFFRQNYYRNIGFFIILYSTHYCLMLSLYYSKIIKYWVHLSCFVNFSMLWFRHIDFAIRKILHLKNFYFQINFNFRLALKNFSYHLLNYYIKIQINLIIILIVLNHFINKHYLNIKHCYFILHILAKREKN